MRNITVAMLMLVLAATVSCGKKASTTDATAQSIVTPLTGTWTGTGTTTTDGGAPTACSVLTVNLAFTVDSVTVSNLTATCGGGTMSQSPLTFSTAGGQLSYQGVNVGTITDQEIHVFMSSGSDSLALDFTIQDATHVTFAQTITSAGHTLLENGTLALQ
jgi:hypothetical protein